MAYFSDAVPRPPFALDGTVTVAKLRELLAVQTELPWLDYKKECDIGKAEGLVEIMKDIGAMMIDGGYLVIGASDTGTPLGIPITKQNFSIKRNYRTRSPSTRLTDLISAVPCMT